MGGEKRFATSVASPAQGSPPRGRGKGCWAAEPCWPNRITPAWAGKSRRARCPGSEPWDHPRVGGEKRFHPGMLPAGQGSPPRGRGKVRRTTHGSGRTGITPAWAGKSDRWHRWRSSHGDHPRVGGEKNLKVVDGKNGEGSPPRGRGKDTLPVVYGPRDRITPAWAGKSPSGGRPHCGG